MLPVTCREGIGGLTPPDLWKIKLLYFSIVVLVLTPLEKQLDPMSPIAYQARSVRHSVKQQVSGPHDGSFLNLCMQLVPHACISEIG